MQRCEQMALGATGVQDTTVFGHRVDPAGEAVAFDTLQIIGQTFDDGHTLVMARVVGKKSVFVSIVHSDLRLSLIQAS